MKADAPILHDDLRTDAMGKKGDKPTNVAVHMLFEKGRHRRRLQAGRRRRRARVPHRQRPPGLHRAARRRRHVERGRPAEDLDARRRARSTPASRRPSCCRFPSRKSSVVPCEIGGGFGGKIAVYLEPVAALLSRKCGRPVKMTMQRERGLRRHRPDARLVRPREARARRRTARSSPARPGWPTTAAAFPAA